MSPGRVALAMILDALSGRSPLFRLQEFYEDKDIELLLGESIPLSKLNDDTLGRVLDRLWKAGTNKVLGSIMLGVMESFDLDTSHVHHDTTSCELYGDYRLYDAEDHDQPFVITNGFSKGHRPDLKKLVLSLLCVDHGIPVGMLICDGNESDKNINKNLIPEIMERMRNLGEDLFVYVADSALITEENLARIDDWDNGFLFVSRLPRTYTECRGAIRRAVEDGEWEDLGALAHNSDKGARYHSFETVVTLYGINYRALVVNSDAHDKRRHKKLEKQLEQDRKELARIKKETERIEFACEPDATDAAHRLPRLAFHTLTASVEPKPKYARGRPKADGTRRVKEPVYRLNITAHVDEQAVEKAQQEAGCFVLITNTLAEGSESISARKLLATYKDQHVVEQNFGFLKDPLFVNALFLKSPKRIEALGLVLVLALLIWRLMERTMRMSLKQSESTVMGWDKRQTARPTTFMMTTKFKGIFVLSSAGNRYLAKPLSSVQAAYLKIPAVDPGVLITPPT